MARDILQVVALFFFNFGKGRKLQFRTVPISRTNTYAQMGLIVYF
jgi:hypothetical protein